MDSAETLYHVAELYRLYKCDSLIRLGPQIDSFLSSLRSSHIDQLYFGSLLSSRADTYGANKVNKEFTSHLADATKNTIANNFNKSNWSYKEGDESAVFSFKSIRAALLLALKKDDNAV